MKLPRLPLRDYLTCAILIVITLAVYWRVVGFDFLSYDDYLYVVDNTPVRAGLTPESIGWAFTTTHASNWHPLTWLSLMMDSTLAGENASAAIYHFTNLILHILNVLLVYALLLKMTASRRRSALVAALFAVHPLHIESVAWIAERKDVLSTAFWLATMLLYVRYTETRNREWYLITIFAFALGCMAKPMLVTLPLALLLLDYWPLQRSKQANTAPADVLPHPPHPQPEHHPLHPEPSEAHPPRHETLHHPLHKALHYPLHPEPRYHSLHPELVEGHAFAEKAPLFALSVLFSLTTYWAQAAGGAVQSAHVRPFGVRAANAVVTYVEYLLKTIYPAKLSVYYPHPGASTPTWIVIVCGAALVGITTLAVQTRGRWPWLFVGWLWYVVTLIPVIGLVQVGDQAMADRYTYIPLIGIFIALVWSIPAILTKTRVAAAALATICVLVIAVLMACSYVQVGYWRNGLTLFRHAISATSPRNVVALFNLGVTYSKLGDDEKAVELYRKAIRFEPTYIDARFNLGNCLTRLELPAEAWAEYVAALKINPKDPRILNAMGYLLVQTGKIDDAIAAYRQALTLDPNNADIQYNLQQVLAAKEGPKP